jgi:ABC-type phosphate transport system substrate-binding protein
MKRLNLFASLIFAAAALVTSANATTVMVLGVGSSAQYKTACIGAFLNLAGPGASHYTSGGTTNGVNIAQMADSRSSSILPEGGNLWVVWNAAQTEVWAYLSVDSVVGNRGYFAQPRTTLQLNAYVESNPGKNKIAAALFGGVADASAVPPAVYNALNNAHFTAAFTDIRPEDAKFAQCRTASTLESVDYTGLGYGTTMVSACLTGPTQVGTPIKSGVTNGATQANPVAFNISGTDPFTGISIPAFTTIPIGAAPIIFIVNRSDTSSGGLGEPGGPTNVSLATIQSIYTTGAHCDTNTLGASGTNKPLTVFNREPMSGTFNTTEFTNFRLTANNHTGTQEFGVNPSALNSNPLTLACGIGNRFRAIGTGEEVSGVFNNPAIVGVNTNSIGYVFFSFANIQPISGTPEYGYLQLAGVDPLQATYTTGELPTCSEPCPVAGGASFPNLRNGHYRSWSLLRVVTDASGTNYTNTKNLVVAAQQHVNLTDPDFVPFLPQGTQNGSNEPGLTLYRSHFLQEGVSPNNGLPNGVGTEHGGDMGGCIETGGNNSGTGVLSCRQ